MHRQLLLPEFGETTQQRLRESRVTVVGAGGLGSPVIAYLAAAGIGQLTVIDDDVIEASNLHRQIIHSADQIGEPKTASARQIVARLAPECEVSEVRVRLTNDNATELLGGADVIVDGSDSFVTRFSVNKAAHALGVPVVWGAVLRWDAQVTVLWPNPPTSAEVSPVSLTDIFEDSEATRRTVGCSTAGVIGALCGQAGSIMALEVIKLVSGVGKPLIGRMMVIDALRGESRTVALSPAVLPDSAVAAAAPIAYSSLPELARVIDVRRASERHSVPAPAHAHHLPLDELLQLGSDQSTWPAFLITDSADQPLIMVCAEGPRSIRAARHLATQGAPVTGFLDGGLR